MNQFSLTISQLEKILKEANEDGKQEDILNFRIKDGRLNITQNDWSRTEVKTLMSKPC